MNPDLKDIDLEIGTETIVPENGLQDKLKMAEKEKKPLVVKLGFDPTAPDLHLGHAVVLKKLREFQDLGHKVVIIIGDFTAHIGDPTGRNKLRPPLSEDQIKENAKTYLDQISKILDVDKADIQFNSQWFDQMNLRDVIKLISNTTLAQITERNDFKQRYANSVPISMHELLYPILQGYDSLMIDSDVEIGGTDQLFNILMGRNIQEARNKVGQIALCMPILRGTDGTEKMSKSKGNHIGLTESPDNMYGKVMSIPDELLAEYVELATSFAKEKREEIKEKLESGENPMEIKKVIAHNVVSQYHNPEMADKAEAFFYSQVQDKSLESKELQPISLEEIGLSGQSLRLVDLCSAIETNRSKGMIRNLIKSGAISVNGEKVLDMHFQFDEIGNETIIKIGKRGYYKILT